MASNDQTYNLSIIAVRLLPHCRESVRKCLKENVFYYLNTNFEISEDGNTISRREGYVDTIDDSFFDPIPNANELRPLTNDAVTTNISLSAIVGKNGDGKSSLVEFIIRLLNNFAFCSGLNPYEHLTFADGVFGELFYRINGTLYKIRIHLHKWRNNTEIYKFTYDETEKAYKAGDELTSYDPDTSMFYTLVSNYSHFAYNTEEFEEERFPGTDEDLWLHRLFHKNDAYQTPINLHPFRDKGNIDVNREKLLSAQRLLTVIVRNVIEDMGGKENGFEVNDKIPYLLRLTDAGYSKLQEVTLKGYFKANRGRNILQEDVRKKYFSNNNRLESLTDLRRGMSPILMQIFTNYVLHAKKGFFKTGRDWMDKNGLLEGTTDISWLIRQLRTKNDKGSTNGKVYPHQYWSQFSKLTAIQFLRLALVHDICRIIERTDMLHIFGLFGREIDTKIIFEDYEKLTYDEKCLHYIIYKTIAVFESYPGYHNPVAYYGTTEVFFSKDNPNLYEGLLFDFTDAMGILKQDWEHKSHITLKLQQTVNFLNGKSDIKDLYDLDTDEKSGQKKREIIFSELTKEQKVILSEIETLPPPIFKYEMLFRKKGESNLISFHTFSSGEKQKLFFQGAIIYHLQNINSVGTGPNHYHAVNLIFEEIELYFHPEWQRRLIFDLMKAIRGANIPNIHSVNMIFVTHSPYILSDIPKSHVLFLKDGAPTYEMQENTFGANINSLLKNGFFLPSLPMGEFAYRKINALFGKLHSGDVDPREMDQLYAQIMTVGEPAIRMQLMSLFASYRKLIVTEEEIIKILPKHNG